MLSLLSIFVPYGLQLLGVVPPSYAFHDGIIEIRPILENYPSLYTPWGLCLVTAAQLVLPALLVARAVEAIVAAERKNFAQAWRLKQLLPDRSA
jgi:serine/threonine-protein kinase